MIENIYYHPALDIMVLVSKEYAMVKFLDIEDVFIKPVYDYIETTNELRRNGYAWIGVV